MTNHPAHQQRHAYKLTSEEAGALLWYRSLPFLARRCLCSFILRLTAGMGVEMLPGSTTWKPALGQGCRISGSTEIINF